VTVNAAGTSLTATSPAGSGAVDVQVTNPLGTSPAVAADQFTYTNPTVSIGAVSQNEGTGSNTQMNFPVTLSSASPSTVTVSYQTADGTAAAPGDYTATSGTLSFSPGTTSLNIPVTVVADTTPETNETFSVQLTSATNATGTPTSATGTIVNDDAAPVLRSPTSFQVKVPPTTGEEVPHTFSVTTPCSMALTSFPCVVSEEEPPMQWHLDSNKFGTKDFDFTWDQTTGHFTITIDNSQVGATLTLTYHAIDGTGVSSLSNEVTLTIHLIANS